MTNQTKYILKVNGDGDYVEVPNHKDLTIARDVDCNRIGMTIHLEFRPDILDFPKTEGTDPYASFIGKNNPTGNKREWSLRIYNKSSTRPNRIAGYIFTPDKTNGVGSYFQVPLTIGEWIKVTMVTDRDYVYLYKNGVVTKCRAYSYISIIKSGCETDPYRPVYPEYRNEPMRIGTDYLKSYFLGAYREIRKYDRPFSSAEVLSLANGTFTDTKNLVFWHNYGLGNATDQSGKGHDGVLHGNAHFEIDTGCIPLSCSISCPSSVNQGDTATLTIIPSGGVSPFTYNWSITKPDTTIDTYMTQNVYYQFSQQGTYSINSGVKDSCTLNIQNCNKTCSVSVVVPTNLDKFGIKKLYQTTSGGREWYSKWDNGVSRKFGSTQDPYDSEFTGNNGNGSYNVDGIGNIKLSNSTPRSYVMDPNKSKYWHNVEISIYGMRVADDNNPDAGLLTVARTNHTIDTNLCDTRGYLFEFPYDGRIYLEKETAHGLGYCDVLKSTYWSGGMPKDMWIGQKCIVYDLSDGTVKLELYIDTTDGSNGGNWIKVKDFIDNGTNFPKTGDSCGASCKSGIDPSLALTNADNRPGSETGKANLTVYFKADGLKTDGLWYKKASIREIQPPI